jgi:hypothetical protein
MFYLILRSVKWGTIGFNGLENIWKDWVLPNQVPHRNLTGGAEGNQQNLSQDNRCSGKVSNRAPPEFKSRNLSLHQPVPL